MGVYYRWVCDERKEYFDPGELLGPKCPSGRGYGIKAGSIPYSAWVVGALATERWSGCKIVLVGDGDDAYDCVGCEEVSQYVLRELIRMAPDEALRFLVNEVRCAAGIAVLEEPSVGRGEDGGRRDERIKILQGWARKDWPSRCGDENCLDFGQRHAGDHRPAPPPPEPEYVLRQFVVGLGSGEASPGEEISLRAEMTSDFRVEKILFGEDAPHFSVRRISVAGVEVPILPGRLPIMPNSGGLPLSCLVKTCQKIEVVVRNDSDERAKIAAAVSGIVRVKNLRWSAPETGEKG